MFSSYIFYTGQDRNPMENSAESIMQMFIMSLGGFNNVYKMMQYCQPVLNYIGKIEFVVFIGLVTVLLVNLLIAMMGNTYSEIAAINPKKGG